ncbi:MAG TPA: hypothetical protein DGH68_00795 [Bacteroidetes bacterium]|jgi:hypothetical protein|nr:hypothetical protein [Bacteroidota bacterium]
MEISAFLESNADNIIDEACTSMDRTHLQHYERDGALRTRDRLATLVSLTRQCVKQRNLAPMIAHAELIAGERFNAGYDLWEVQTAFNVLEEAIWARIFKNFPPGELAEAIGLVSTVLGAGKDALARKYVSLASKTKASSLNLQSLFSGAAG